MPPVVPFAHGQRTVPTPPAPTVTASEPLGVTDELITSLTPPPPPPPPTHEPPPPPPPAARASIRVTPLGTVQEQDPAPWNSVTANVAPLLTYVEVDAEQGGGVYRMRMTPEPPAPPGPL